MENITEDKISGRRRMAEEWITEADKHIRAAKYLVKKKGLTNLTLYHIQQSMEMATKGLARASGFSHQELKGEIRHNNLFLFGKIIETVIDSLQSYQEFNDMLTCFYQESKNYDSVRHIKDFLTATASPKQAKDKDTKRYANKIFASGMGMTPNEVKLMLDSFDGITGVMQIPAQTQSLIRKITAEPVNISTPIAETNWMDDIVTQAIQQLTERIGTQADPAIIAHIQRIARIIPTNEQEMAAELKATNGKFHYDGEQFIKETTGIFNMLSANLGLLMIGSLVWAHESYPRYPADPSAPDSIELAVKERKLGAKHYTQEMGVIKHIKPLTQKADKTIRLLKKSYKAGYLLMATKDLESPRP